MKKKFLGMALGVITAFSLCTMPVMAAGNVNVIELGVSSGGVVASDYNNLNVITLQTSHADVGTSCVLLPNGVVFDYGYYALQYSDVRKAVGTSYTALLNHYATYGVVEGRFPNADAALKGTVTKGSQLNIELLADGRIFDGDYYAAANPDVVEVYGNSRAALLKHYTKYGAKEGRRPNGYQ